MTASRFTLFFPPFRIDKKADVAQLVEQPIRNRQVSGSSPLVGSIPSLLFMLAKFSHPRRIVLVYHHFCDTSTLRQ